MYVCRRPSQQTLILCAVRGAPLAACNAALILLMTISNLSAGSAVH
jgi:hypothetical protein